MNSGESGRLSVGLSDSSLPITKTFVALPFESIAGVSVKSKRKYCPAWENG